MSKLQQAMADLKAGRITPDQFRAISRESKRRNGSRHEAMLALANAANLRSQS